jgi:uncharacterized protein with NRDE domain
MCTVTFIPKGKDEFILTTNRDENAARSPRNITITERDVQLVFPRDNAAGGTWVAMSNTNKVACVLNGAFERHERNLPYRMSRGVMALQFFDFERAEHFFDEFQFEGMEAFTMVIYDNGKLYDFRWDEEERHIKEFPTDDYHIWSSATLYDKPIREKREQWFADWLEKNDEYDLASILDFHFNAGDGDPWNDVIMNRNGMVQTVSVTSIIKTHQSAEMLYHDLLREEVKQAKIELDRNLIEVK